MVPMLMHKSLHGETCAVCACVRVCETVSDEVSLLSEHLKTRSVEFPLFTSSH